SRSRGADLVMHVDVVRSDGIEINPEIQEDIDECFAYVDALRDRGIDARVVVEAVDREDTPEPAQEGAVEVTYETLGDLVQRFHDHTKAIPVHRVQVIEGAQREQGHRIVGAETAVTVLTKRVAELERENKRIRGTMPNTRSGASMTHGEIEDLIAHRVAEEIEAREAAMNLEPLNENGDEQEGGNGGNGGNGNGGDGGNGNGGNGGNGNGGNGGNGNGRNEGNGNEGNGENKNGNRNRNHGMNYGGFMLVARECTFQDFLKLPSEICYMHTAGQCFDLMEHSQEDNCERKRFDCLRTKGNVIAAEPTKLQDAIRVANNLMDQKLKGYARSAENKRSLDNNTRDNHGQQPVFKRQNVGGQNVARMKERVENQSGVICYKCGRPGHFRKDCPKLRNQFHGNWTRNKNGNKTGGNEATAKAYAIGGRGTNPDSNVVT
ncbi:putative reverse transcriptase domain-containing protein, partial [Tanacetum coccineum]